MKKLCLLFFYLILLNPIANFAQKFGHFNSGNFIESMPEREAADQTLQAFQKPLLEEIQAKDKAMKEKYAKVRQQVVDGKLSQKEIQLNQAELEKEQTELKNLDAEAQRKIYNKREELFQPILAKVSEALSAVGKENGFTFIFDTSVYNAILYTEETEDVAPLVRKKLGL